MQGMLYEFLSRVLSDSGTHYLTSLTMDGHVRTYPMDKSELLTRYKDLLHWGEKYKINVNFAPASFTIPHGVDAKKGRRSAFVSHLRCCWVDIDIGKSEEEFKLALEQGQLLFANADDILASTSEKFRMSKVPEPTYIIRSGRGVHFYWVLDDDYSVEVWYLLQSHICASIKKLGYVIDLGASMRYAGTMRIPTSYNPKIDGYGAFHSSNSNSYNPKELSDSLEHIVPKSTVNVHSTKLLNRPDFIVPNEDFSEWGLSARLLPRWDVVKNNCGYLQWYEEHKGSACYDDWLPAMTVAKECEDGDKLIHTLSVGHPSYDEQMVNNIVHATHSSYSCKSICAMTTWGNKCKSCKNWSDDVYRKPVMLDRRITVADDDEQVLTVNIVNKVQHTETNEYALGDLGLPLQNANTVSTKLADIKQFLPPNFKALASSDEHPNGGIVLVSRDSADIMVCDLLIYVVGTVDVAGLKEYVLRVHLPREPVKDIRLQGGFFSKPQELLAFLNDRGVIPDLRGSKRRELFVDYLRASAMQNQQNYDATITRQQFGWDENRESFLLGSWNISGASADKARVTHLNGECNTYVEAFTPPTTASVKAWADACKMYSHEGMELAQFVLCSALATPLLAVVPTAQGALVNLFSRNSGVGKSTLCYTALSIWGRPRNAGGNQRGIDAISRDTTKSVFKMFAAFQHLPVYMDEVSSQTPRQLYDFVYHFTQGRDMNRVQRNGERTQQNTSSWQTVAFSSSNNRITDKLNSMASDNQEALHMRVIEIDMGQMRSACDVMSNGERVYSDSDINNNIHSMHFENYAIVGQDFIRRIAGKADNIRLMWDKVDSYVQSKFNFTQAERFWRAVVVSSMVALQLAKKFGYFDYDMDKILNALHGVLRSSRDTLTDSKFDLTEAISDYLLYHQTNGVIAVANSNNARTTATGRNVTWRLDHQANVCYIAKTSLKDWLQDRFNLTPSEVTVIMKENSVGDAKIFLLKGVPASENYTQTRCFMFNDIEKYGIDLT